MQSANVAAQHLEDTVAKPLGGFPQSSQKATPMRATNWSFPPARIAADAANARTAQDNIYVWLAEAKRVGQRP